MEPVTGTMVTVSMGVKMVLVVIDVRQDVLLTVTRSVHKLMGFVLDVLLVIMKRGALQSVEKAVPTEPVNRTMVTVAMAVLEGSMETCVRETVLITVIMLYVTGQMEL